MLKLKLLLLHKFFFLFSHQKHFSHESTKNVLPLILFFREMGSYQNDKNTSLQKKCPSFLLGFFPWNHRKINWFFMFFLKKKSICIKRQINFCRKKILAFPRCYHKKAMTQACPSALWKLVLWTIFFMFHRKLENQFCDAICWEKQMWRFFVGKKHSLFLFFLMVQENKNFLRFSHGKEAAQIVILIVFLLSYKKTILSPGMWKSWPVRFSKHFPCHSKFLYVKQ